MILHSERLTLNHLVECKILGREQTVTIVHILVNAGSKSTCIKVSTFFFRQMTKKASKLRVVQEVANLMSRLCNRRLLYSIS